MLNNIIYKPCNTVWEYLDKDIWGEISGVNGQSLDKYNQKSTPVIWARWYRKTLLHAPLKPETACDWSWDYTKHNLKQHWQQVGTETLQASQQSSSIKRLDSNLHNLRGAVWLVVFFWNDQCFLYHDTLYVSRIIVIACVWKHTYSWYCDPLPSVFYKSSLPLSALMDFSSCWEVDWVSDEDATFMLLPELSPQRRQEGRELQRVLLNTELEKM